MGIMPMELAVQRKLTAAFIAADSLQLALLRTPAVPDGAGGVRSGPTQTLPAQTLRLIPLGDGAQERFTRDGVAVTPSYMLMGKHDADIQRFDEFTLDGRRYQVVFVNQNQQYEVKGEVAYRG
jgi:hypothetical protein